MKNYAAALKPYLILTPLAQAATASGTAKQFTPGELKDAIAVVLVGATSGTPDSFTVVVTIEQSATSGGSYTATATLPTNTTANQVGTQQVILDQTKPWVRATATIAFVNGTSPKINVGVALLVAQVVASDSNLGILS